MQGRLDERLAALAASEVCFGVVQHEDEFLGFAGPGRSQAGGWRPAHAGSAVRSPQTSAAPEAHEELQMVPCGYLEPLEVRRCVGLRPAVPDSPLDPY